MKASDIPQKFNIPFADQAGTPTFRHTVPQPSQQPGNPGAASLETGFPPANFSPTGAGGVPPDGADMNGIIWQSTAWDRWFSAGGPVKWDSAFSAAVGGYPQGSVVASTTTLGLFWLSVADDNTSNPDIGGANWRAFSFGASVTGQCYLQRTNSTQATLLARGGATIVIAGVPCAIPSAGIVLDITNCYVNGTAGGALAPNTVYNAYLFNNAGTLTIDCWTGVNSGHAPDTTAGNVGIEVRNVSGTPDSTRSLIGKVYPITGPVLGVQGISVLSWFSKQDVVLALTGISGTSSTGNADPIGSGIDFLSWGTDSTEIKASGTIAISPAQRSISSGFLLDAVGLPGSSTFGAFTGVSTGVTGSMGAIWEGVPSEGHHQVFAFAQSSVVGANAALQNVAMFVHLRG